MGKRFLLYLCLFMAGCVCEINSTTLKYCVPKMSLKGFGTLKYACKKVYDQQMQCVIAEDRSSCLLLLNKGQVDATVAEPEDLRLLSYNESKVLITHQLMKFSEKSPQMNTEMMAIVKSNFTSSWTTKGKKLCYLGLETSYSPQYNYYYTQYFESWLFPTSCDPEITTLENRIANLSSYFNSACIAGPWSLDKTIDRELKTKYRNLCALCYVPEDCDEYDIYYGVNGALTCLTRGTGDVAWTSKSEAEKYFAHLSSLGYSALCPDGTFGSLTGEDVCTWIMEPEPVIIANKNVADVVLKKFHDKGEDHKYFYQIVHSVYRFTYLKKLDKPIGVQDYLKSFPGYFSASTKMEQCRSSHVIRWCVSTDLEEKKCRHLKMASEALRLKPAFDCIRRQNRSEVISGMRNGKCEVFTIQSGDAHEAQGVGLKSVIDILPNKRDDLNVIGAVVRKNSTFKSYKDLKGASACFTGYRSTGWNAFYSTLKSDCSVSEPSDINAISSYFSKTCVLGIDPNNETFPSNLHSLCKDADASLEAEERTFKCLENGADVAFVNVSAAKVFASRSTVFSTTYKVLCSKVQDKSCFLTKVILGSVLVHENITKVREDEMYMMFLALDRYFGRTHDRETPMFNMYEAFEGHSNVLFPAATMTLRRSVAGLKYGIIADNTNTAVEVCEVIYGSHHNRGMRVDFMTPVLFVLTFLSLFVSY